MVESAKPQEIISYIEKQPVFVLGTIGKDGTPHGAAVYVYPAMAEVVYFISKTQTQKIEDLRNDPRVCLTGFNADANSTLQLNGHASTESNAQIIDSVMKYFVNLYSTNVDWLPPVAKIDGSSYQVVRVEVEYARLAFFQGERAGSPHIFKEYMPKQHD